MSLLAVSGVSKSFGGVHAVTDVSLEVNAGEVVALIGPNGAGKSTCFNMLNGQLRPESGSIRFADTEIVGRRPREVWRLGISRTFQIAETYGSMTVAENVQLVLLSRHRRLFNLWSRAREQYRPEAMALLGLVDMEGQAARPCSELAYGDVKRVELAMALANEPRLLLMDEPTAGMAPKERNELMALTARLSSERNIAVLFTEHSMDVVFSYATRVLVLSRGKLIASGDPATVRDNKQVQEVYLGSSHFLQLGQKAAA
jgi:branched-chain amino acid transport system ATP-binding protein